MAFFDVCGLACETIRNRYKNKYGQDIFWNQITFYPEIHLFRPKVFGFDRLFYACLFLVCYIFYVNDGQILQFDYRIVTKE